MSNTLHKVISKLGDVAEGLAKRMDHTHTNLSHRAEDATGPKRGILRAAARAVAVGTSVLDRTANHHEAPAASNDAAARWATDGGAKAGPARAPHKKPKFRKHKYRGRDAAK